MSDDPFSALRKLGRPQPEEHPQAIGGPLTEAGRPGSAPKDGPRRGRGLLGGGSPPLMDPQPAPLTPAMLKRGALRALATAAACLIASAIAILPTLSYIRWEFLLRMALATAAVGALMGCTAVLERALGLRDAPASKATWVGVWLLLSCAMLLPRAWLVYLTQVSVSFNPQDALEGTTELLFRGAPRWLSYGAISSLPYVALLHSRHHGLPLKPTLTRVVACACVLAFTEFFWAGAWGLQLSMVLAEVALGVLLVWGWQVADRRADRRWGAVPVAREAVQALLHAEAPAAPTRGAPAERDPPAT